MMGHSHAISGAAIYVAITLPNPLGFGALDQAPHAILFGALMAAGAALLPDWDHPQATISHALPPLSNLAAHGISTISGGHRRGTHTLLGLTIATALTFALGFLTLTINNHPTALGAGILTCFLATLAAKALHLFPRNGYLTNWALGLSAGTLVATTTTFTPGALVLPVAIGYTAHLAGDAITTGRIKPLLPFSSIEFGIPILGNTGSWREHLLTTALSLYTLAGIYSAARPLINTINWPPTT